MGANIYLGIWNILLNQTLVANKHEENHLTRIELIPLALDLFL